MLKVFTLDIGSVSQPVEINYLEEFLRNPFMISAEQFLIALRDNILSPLDYGYAYEVFLGEKDYRAEILKTLDWLDNLQWDNSREENNILNLREYFREILEGILFHCKTKDCDMRLQQ